MKIRFIYLAAFALICFTLFPACSSNKASSILSLPAGGTDRFHFATRDVEGFRELMTGAGDSNVKGVGTLHLPPTASRENRVAVMVILHGSGGEWSGRGADHAAFLTGHGIGAFVIDTFVSRGLKKKDKYIRRLLQVNFPDQLTDAFAALELLQAHPLVDGDRIGVMGYSMGGISTILAADEGIAKLNSQGNARFALHVPFYPPCIIQFETGTGTGAPIVGLWGEADESTPRPRCEELIKNLEGRGNPVDATWFPGAAHGWNGKSPMRFYEKIPNFSPCRYVIHEDGSITERVAQLTTTTDAELIAGSEGCVGYGYTIGHHDETHARANEALLKAIEEYMPGPEL